MKLSVGRAVMASRLVPFAILLLISSLFGNAFADGAAARGVYGGRPGYLFNVQEEKDKRDLEMVMLDPPPAPARTLNEAIFDRKLTKEFQSQYSYRFGATEAQQVMNSPGRYDQYTYYNDSNVSVQDYQAYQRSFGNYMGRRLFEYHVDNWAKKDPSVRPLYEVKDKVSNLSVQMKKGYKFKWKYSLSGNYMDFRLENPYDIETKVTVQMAGGLSPDETIFDFGYRFTKRVRMSALYKIDDGLYQLVGSRQMTQHLAATLTGSIDTRKTGPAVQQNLILVGLSWSE